MQIRPGGRDESTAHPGTGDQFGHLTDGGGDPVQPEHPYVVDDVTGLRRQRLGPPAQRDGPRLQVLGLGCAAR